MEDNKEKNQETSNNLQSEFSRNSNHSIIYSTNDDEVDIFRSSQNSTSNIPRFIRASSLLKKNKELEDKSWIEAYNSVSSYKKRRVETGPNRNNNSISSTKNAEPHLVNLINDNSTSDVVLKSNDGQEIFAHKAILIICSDFFKSCFFNQWSKENKERVVTLDSLSYAQLRHILYFIYSGLLCWSLEISAEEIPLLAEGCVFLQVRSGVYSLRERLAHSFRKKSYESREKQNVLKNLLHYEQNYGSTETLINQDLATHLETMLKERIREVIKLEFMLLNTLVTSSGNHFQTCIFNFSKNDSLQHLQLLCIDKEEFIVHIVDCVEHFITQEIFLTTVADYCFQQTRDLGATLASTREVQLKVSTPEGVKQISRMLHKDAKDFLTFLKTSLAESKLLTEIIQKKGIGEQGHSRFSNENNSFSNNFQDTDDFWVDTDGIW